MRPLLRCPFTRAGPEPQDTALDTNSAVQEGAAAKTAFSILAAISVCHLLNDMMQSLLPAIYPILKQNYGLDFGQIGLLTLTFQSTASLLQPVVGSFTDRRPKPYSLALGMGVSLVALVLLSRAGSYPALLIGAACIGIGSAVLHPESSRVARMASGGRHGLAQSLFQVGGNVGSSVGPLLAAFVVLRYGQSSLAWFALAALTGMALLVRVGRWYKAHGLSRLAERAELGDGGEPLSRARVASTFGLLFALIFSKFFYMATMTSYLTFYLIDQFDVSVRNAQIHLFVFLGSVALGTLLGGSLGDRFGRKAVIWASILGVLPFTLALPYANLFWTGHRRLRPGADSRPGRDDRGSVLRSRFRSGRHRGRRGRPTGGRGGYRLRVSLELLPAGARSAGGLPAGGPGAPAACCGRGRRRPGRQRGALAGRRHDCGLGLWSGRRLP
jgi:FSR family fosmidomycin resistance protein-like MFS transporter